MTLDNEDLEVIKKTVLEALNQALDGIRMAGRPNKPPDLNGQDIINFINSNKSKG